VYGVPGFGLLGFRFLGFRVLGVNAGLVDYACSHEGIIDVCCTFRHPNIHLIGGEGRPCQDISSPSAFGEGTGERVIELSR
jgi:hypothetical protein